MCGFDKEDILNVLYEIIDNVLFQSDSSRWSYVPRTFNTYLLDGMLFQ